MFFKKKKIMSDSTRAYYYNLLDEIMKSCFDNDTNEFNWDIWFERRDEIIWCGDDSILNTIASEFSSYGRFQVQWISACLENSFDSKTGKVRKDMVNKLKNMESNIIRNLESMFSMQKGEFQNEICPKNIIEFRNNLYKLLDGEIEWTKENIRKMIEIRNFM